MLDFLKSALPYVMTFLGGSAVTMYGQSWTTFHFKRQQDLYDKRRDLLNDWKKNLYCYFDLDPFGYALYRGGIPDKNYHTLMMDPSYTTLEPHLTEELAEKIRKWNRMSVDPQDCEAVRDEFRKELARIERKWKLI